MAETTMTRNVASNEAYLEPTANETNEHASFMKNIKRHLFRSKRLAAVFVWTRDEDPRAPEAQGLSDEESKEYIIPSRGEEPDLKGKDNIPAVGGYTVGYNKAENTTTQRNITAIEGIAAATGTGGVLHNETKGEAVQINLLTSSVSPDVFKNIYHKTPTIVENGLLAVLAYKADPAAFRCILMGKTPETLPARRGHRALIIEATFLDWAMPVMGGAEATKQIRAFEASYGLRPCVIIAMFPSMNISQREAVLKAGCDTCIEKPLRIGTLLRLLFGDEKHNILYQRGDLTEEEAQSLSLSPRPLHLDPAQRSSSTRRKQARMQQLRTWVTERLDMLGGAPTLYRAPDLKQLIAGRPENVDRNAEKFILARTALKKVQSTFENTNLEYDRVLGYGGFGVAVKYSQKNGTGQHLRHIVVKAPVRPNRPSTVESLIHEYTWYDFVKGMEHVPFLVNPVPLYRSPPPPPDSGQEPEHLGDRDFISAQGHFLITEFLEHGELIALVQRLNAVAMAQPNSDTSPKLTFIPNRLLWRIFLCLVRSTIAMAWPYAVASWRNDYMEEHKDDVPPVTIQEVDDMLVEEPYREDIWDGVKTENVVHFDIDLHNIFLGQSNNPQDGEHDYFRAVNPTDDPETNVGLQDEPMGHWAGDVFLDDEGQAQRRPSEEVLSRCHLQVPGRHGDGSPADVRLVPRERENDQKHQRHHRFGPVRRGPALHRRDAHVAEPRRPRHAGPPVAQRDGPDRRDGPEGAAGELPEWETDAALHRFVNEYIKNAPENVSAAGAALEAPTPQPAGALGAAVQQFGNMNLGGGGGAGP
ncbi:kinase-like domain-containing protein [Apiospora aurea]|uniref:Kinase-like domain-containing protein n=1 Tax=Apiospora aurea TaxID=335848 RepID=A0ABR1QRR6_9PEZI